MYFKSTLNWLILLFFLTCLTLGNGQQQNTLSLILFKNAHPHQIIQRSDALKKKAVLLKSGDSLNITLCVRRDAEYTVRSVRYSNDGAADAVSLWLDSQKIGSFSSSEASKYGLQWNVFHESKQIGTSMNLQIGTYVLRLCVDSADVFGIEIDAIFLQTTDMTVGEEILECILYCLPNPKHDTDAINSTVSPMQLVQHSFPTKCAEQDNIDIAIYHDHITRYQITATYPKYNHSLNTRHAIFDNCEDLSPQLLWRLKNKPYDPAQNVQTNLKSFELNLSKNEPMIINITFRLKGKDNGSIDSDIGSVLKVAFKNLYNSFDITCRFITRNGYFSAPIKSFVTKEQQNFTCATPDYTWTEHKINTIQLILISSLDNVVQIDVMQLSRRDEKGQTKTNIYKDQDTIIEGRNVDFWWRRPRTMAVKLQDEIFQNIDFIVIYKRVPATTRFNQILVLYEDGNSRLLPLPSKDIDWIPFGSSVIIGQSDLPSFRPVAVISRIDVVSITTSFIEIRLHYLDGGSALVTISTNNIKTVLEVSQLNFGRSLQKYPFARFRSMWVTDGKCDVDHLKVDSGQNIEILKPWNKLNGSVVEFFRMCQSIHLNLSPDISLQVLN